MSTKSSNLRLAVMSDIHVETDAPPAYAGLLGEISHKADILLLGGDLTANGSLREAEIIAEDLKNLSLHKFAVLGNHDYDQGEEREIKNLLMARAGVVFLDEHPQVVKEVGFVGVKGFGGGFGRNLLSPFGENAIKHFVGEAVGEVFKLENQLKDLRARKKAVLLHYAPIAETIKGEPLEIYPFIGCSRLAEAIDRYRVDLVFHGHSHHGVFSGKTPGGTPVYNCAVTVVKKETRSQPYALFTM